MSKRYYIGNPRTILTPDAYESVFAVDSGYSLFDRKVVMMGLSDEDDGFKFESKKEIKR